MNDKLTSEISFSLVLATLGRTKEIAFFLKSLSEQINTNIELIVVDQNEDERLLPILALYKNSFVIKHIKSERGLSKARNVGLMHVTGDIVTFPDDDCWYPKGVLCQVADVLLNHPDYDGVTGILVDENRHVAMSKFDREDGAINRFNVWNRSTAATIFIKHSVIADVGGFDEKLGVGSGTPWGAAEEIDYLIRAVLAGKKLHFEHQLEIGHPRTDFSENDMLLVRTASYAQGAGYVIRKHRYPMYFALWIPFRSLLGSIQALATGNSYLALVRWTRATSIYKGWLGSITRY